MDKTEFQAWLQNPITREVAQLLRDKAKEAKIQRETLDPRGHAANPAEFYERALMYRVREMVWDDCATFLTDEEVFEEEFEEAEDGI